MSRVTPAGRLVGILLSLLLVSCVEHPLHGEGGEQAQLRSWMKILEIDGSAPDDLYRVMLAPGQHRMKVLYETYQHNYLCLFEFQAVGGYSYEVVDHSNPQPLIMYSWVRVNGAWAERLDPVMPQCDQIQRP